MDLLELEQYQLKEIKSMRHDMINVSIWDDLSIKELIETLEEINKALKI